MEIWQIFVSICAGIITILTFFDKIGVSKAIKKLEGLNGIPRQVDKILVDMDALKKLQSTQNEALMSILRHDLYESFKKHRTIGAWTDDECRVQTQIHEAYRALNGNGEEDIWWQNKVLWKILSEEDFQDHLKTKL